MDPLDKSNESKIRGREETLARRVGEALDQLKPGGARECPDAEIIASYAEQALEPAESTRWESHFANCARCRKILRVLAASADTPLAGKEVAQLGELVSAVRAPVEIAERSVGRARPRLVDWRTRWLAPALGMAAVLAVWFALRPPWRVADRGASETLVAQAPREEAPPNASPEDVDRLSKPVPQQDQKTEGASPPTPSAPSSGNARSLNSPAQTPAKLRADAANEIEGTSPSAGSAAGSLQEKKETNGAPIGREIQPPSTPPLPSASNAKEAPAAPASAAPEAKAALDAGARRLPQAKTKVGTMGNATSRDKESADAQAEAGAATGGAVAQQAPAESPSKGRKNQPSAAFRPLQKYSALLKAPSGSTLWRAGNDGLIERSLDAGKTWVPQTSPSPQDWLAGAAVSSTVCWLVGRNGSIARTTDGEHWIAVNSPPLTTGSSGKLPDWVAVTATGAQAAVVTSGDQQRYATQDGGQTWKAQ